MFNTSKSYIVPSVFAPSDMGIFSIYPKDDDKYFGSYWDTCREQFAKKFLADSFGFFISVSDDKDCLVKFIKQCEDLLNIEQKSDFFETDMGNVIFIIPSKFWMPCYMRRSLFTLLCRNGIYYNKKNFERYLLGEVEHQTKDKIGNCLAFAKKTRNAIIRFFAGFNNYVGSGPNFDEIFPEKHGWVVEFDGKGQEYIKKVLITGKENPFMLRFFGKSMYLS
jgi:hypothetical protein